MAKLTDQIDTLVKNTDSTDKNVKLLMSAPVTMKKTDIIIEDMCYVLPMYWSCLLQKDQFNSSPMFYCAEGYRMSLKADWHTGKAAFVVGVVLRKGINDYRPGMWPWHGEEMQLLTHRRDDGVELARGVLASYSDSGRIRPTDYISGNGYYLISCDLPHNNDNTFIEITLRRK